MCGRELGAGTGGYTDGDFPEDWHLWLKLLSRGFRLRNLPRVVFRWTDHEQRLTRTDPRYGLDRHQRLRARFLVESTLPRGAPVLLWGAGQTRLSLGRLLRAQGVAVERFIEVSPKKVGQRIEGVPVSSPSELGPPGALHLTVAVGAKGAREEIRRFLAERGWQEGPHFTCAA